MVGSNDTITGGDYADRGTRRRPGFIGWLTWVGQRVGRGVIRFVSLRSWQLTIILLLLIFLSATLLRFNNIGMIERRDAVIAADKKGNDDETRLALIELQRYVSTHMNTNLDGGVYRETAYKRDYAIALEAASAGTATNPASATYQQASVECRSRFQGGVASFRADYVQCVIDRVSELDAASGQSSDVSLPKVDTYRYNFISPLWTPDLAGITLALTGVTALVIVVRVVRWLINRIVLQRRFRRLTP